MNKSRILLVLAPLAFVATACTINPSSTGGRYSDRTVTSKTSVPSTESSEKEIVESYSFTSTSWDSAETPASTSGSISIDTGIGSSASEKSGLEDSYANVIKLADNASTIKGTGATVSSDGNMVTISASGTYLVEGSLSNGNIFIDADDEGTVTLDLNGVSITKSGTLALAPIYASKSAKLKIKKLSGTTSIITDNRTSRDETNYEDSAAIFSNKKLSIVGSGELVVSGNLNNGIASDTKIEAKNGTLKVTSANHAIKAHKSIELGDRSDEGTFILDATGDGLRVDEDKTSELDEGEFAGVKLKEGSYSVTSKDDAINSESNVYITGGEGILSATKTGSNSGSKGIVSGIMTYLEGGTYQINSASDDGVHSNGSVQIKDGTYTISAGDDGVHADDSLEILGGCTTVTKAYEGFEAIHISISGGTNSVTTSDDGMNAAGGSDTGSGGWGWDGGNISSSVTPTIDISGGYNYVYAKGDGIDSNGNITISGGFTVVCQIGGGNGPMDYGDSSSNYFKQSGGFLAAYGSSDMLVTSTGTQYSVITKISSAVSTSNYMVVTNGDVKFAIKPSYSAYSLYISDPSFTAGTVSITKNTAISGGNEVFKGVYKDFETSGTSTSIYSGTWSASSINLNNGAGGGGGGRPGGPGGGPR